MSNEPRRRSTRLANTPKVSYEEKKIDLRSSQSTVERKTSTTTSTTRSSGRKRRDSKNSSDDKKKSKKIKLIHEVTNVKVNDNNDDNEDDDVTVVSEFDYNSIESSDDSTILSSATENSVDNQLYVADDDEDTEDDLIDDEYLSENASTDSEASREKSQDSFMRFMSLDFPDLSPDSSNHQNTNQANPNDSVQEDSSLISNNPFGSQNNQNILDVTNYDKFKDDDRSNNNDKVNENSETPKRIKKFKKKGKTQPNSNVVISKLIKHVDEDKMNYVNEDLSNDEPVKPSPAKGSQVLIISTRRKKIEEMKTNFADFFKREKISKSNSRSRSMSPDKSLNSSLVSSPEKSPIKSSNEVKDPFKVPLNREALKDESFESSFDLPVINEEPVEPIETTKETSFEISIESLTEIPIVEPSKEEVSTEPIKETSPELSLKDQVSTKQVKKKRGRPTKETSIDNSIDTSLDLSPSKEIPSKEIPKEVLIESPSKESEPVSKKKRGRPNKEKTTELLIESSKETSPELSLKEQVTIEPVVKKRGRPKKSDTVVASKPSTNTIEQLTALNVIESDNEINVIEVIAKSEKSNSPTSDTIISNEKNVELSTPSISGIVVLDAKEENSTITSRSDDPWTVKYKPLSSDQVLDNKEASKAIKDWIQEFMTKPDDRFYYDDEDDEVDALESCLLVYGPTGCGKTAMIYAIAEELNYNVFEINCSSRRNSKYIHQIKEATLSHTVLRGSANNSPFKINPKKSKQPAVDLKQKNLFSFFQKKSSLSATTAVQQPTTNEDSISSQEDLKLTINKDTLILFDDVDIIFEEDSGFWQALSSLIENTKRPVILTATNSIDNIRQEIKRALFVPMIYPTLSSLQLHLSDIVFKECYHIDRNEIDKTKKRDHDYNKSPLIDRHVKQIELISRDSHCDIRSCVNRLQFDFSSVNITKEEEDNEHVLVQTTSTNVNNDGDEINLSSYNNLILSDLFATNHQLNSRDELDNSCAFDETYKSKDLRECILIEFNKLNNEQFKLLNDQRETDCKLDLDWLTKFNECCEEVEEHLPIASKQDFHCDYLPYLSIIMNLEQERFKLFVQHTRRARRFLHHLDNIQFHLTNSQKNFLNESYLHCD